MSKPALSRMRGLPPPRRAKEKKKLTPVSYYKGLFDKSSLWRDDGFSSMLVCFYEPWSPVGEPVFGVKSEFVQLLAVVHSCTRIRGMEISMKARGRATGVASGARTGDPHGNHLHPKWSCGPLRPTSDEQEGASRSRQGTRTRRQDRYGILGRCEA